MGYRLGPNTAYAVEVAIRFLGTASVAPPENDESVASGEEQTPEEISFFEIVADVRGPRGVHVIRRLGWARNATIEP